MDGGELIFSCVYGNVWRDSEGRCRIFIASDMHLNTEGLTQQLIEAMASRIYLLGKAGYQPVEETKPKPAREELLKVIAAAWYKSQEGDVVTIAKSWGAIADAVLEVL
jgi:hypothetical protein